MRIVTYVHSIIVAGEIYGIGSTIRWAPMKIQCPNHIDKQRTPCSPFNDAIPK